MRAVTSPVFGRRGRPKALARWLATTSPHSTPRPATCCRATPRSPTRRGPQGLRPECLPAGDRLYVGGTFNRVGTTAVSNLAAIDPTSCSILPATTFRRPAVLATVRALDSTATNVYAGGDFNTVDSQARTKYAAFDSKGNLLPTSLTLGGGKVNAIMAVPDFGEVFLGGDFTSENGIANRGLVAVDPTTSAIETTFPGWIPANSAVKAFARDDTGFYVGDEGTGFGVFDGRIAGELATDTMRWKDYCLGATQALAVYQGVLYAGNHAHECQTTPGGWLEDGLRNHFTAQDVRDRTTHPDVLPGHQRGHRDGAARPPRTGRLRRGALGRRGVHDGQRRRAAGLDPVRHRAHEHRLRTGPDGHVVQGERERHQLAGRRRPERATR